MEEAPVKEAPAVPKPEKPVIPEIESPEAPVQDEGGAILAGKLEKGQSILSSLERHGLPGAVTRPLVLAMEEVFDFRKARVGDSYELEVSADGQLTRFSYRPSSSGRLP